MTTAEPAPTPPSVPVADGRRRRRTPSRPTGPRRDGTLDLGRAPPWCWSQVARRRRPGRHRLDLRAGRGRARSSTTCSAPWSSAARPLDAARRLAGDGPGRAQRRPARAGRDGALRGRHRPVGPRGPAARAAAAPAARAPVRDDGAGLRQRRLHHRTTTDAPAPSSRGWIDARAAAGEDQDRRVLGHATSERDLAPGRRWPGDVVGDDVEVFVDANGGYTAHQAVRVGRRLDELGVTWFEEPVSLRRPRRAATGSATACAPTSPPASTATAWPTSPTCAPRHRRLRPGRRHPLRRLHRVAPHRRRWPRRTASRCPATAPRHCTRPVAAATPNLRHLEWFHDHVRIESRFFDGFPSPRAGRWRRATAGARPDRARTRPGDLPRRVTEDEPKERG